ncbi:hypothetical protein FNW52_18080 [Flavobacterium sp. ZT3R18]|uniref:hypothetical protein n=1 Tax=Flavobacterium sp. ZT3R18 TaxID=2594429 RepID=UPI00117A87B5|nr:hypothetical protein [Flavobacterium sp. ZT3R18]TRX31901.1 hypothetical protein FNW52_18080 [Flavobacterium sp. ZT3R18]
MQQLEKVIELLTQKYNSSISVFGKNKDGKQKSIIDTENGTLFTVSNDSVYITFTDKDGNIWLTVPKSFIFNDQRYYPAIGSEYTRSDGQKYTFVTQEVVVSMARDYFEKFVDENYGIEKRLNYLLFSYEGDQYVGDYNRFKSKIHNKIDAYISNN